MTGPELISSPRTADRRLSELVHPVERVIEPVRSRTRLRDLPAHAAVIRVLAARDFKTKYKQSLLGPLWLLIQPLALLGAFALVFSTKGETDGAPYALFALTGLCVWAWFQAALTLGGASLISNYILVRRTACPRVAFPVASTIATLPTLALTGGATLILALATGELSPRVLALPLAVVWLFVLTISISALTAAAAVYYRDVLNALPFFLQVGVFLAPVGYSLNDVSGPMQVVLRLNPLTGIIDTWRWLVLPGAHLDTAAVAIAAGFTVLLVTAALRLFGRAEVHMADVI